VKTYYFRRIDGKTKEGRKKFHRRTCPPRNGGKTHLFPRSGAAEPQKALENINLFPRSGVGTGVAE
jgi:hypothetical protein